MSGGVGRYFRVVHVIDVRPLFSHTLIWPAVTARQADGIRTRSASRHHSQLVGLSPLLSDGAEGVYAAIFKLYRSICGGERLSLIYISRFPRDHNAYIPCRIAKLMRAMRNNC